MERVKAMNSGSGNVASYGYQEQPPILEVEFAGRNGRANSVYQYPGVPREKWLGLLQATSAGSFINTEIKPTWAATKIQ